MHGNQWVLKIAVLKYYSVSKRGTTAKSNPKQATDPISLHTKFGDNSSNTFPLNERKPCVTPDIGRRTPDIGHRTTDIGHRTAKKAKIIYPPPRGVDIIISVVTSTSLFVKQKCASVGDKEPLLLNIFTSVLCQFEECAIIWRQAVSRSFAPKQVRPSVIRGDHSPHGNLYDTS